SFAGRIEVGDDVVGEGTIGERRVGSGASLITAGIIRERAVIENRLVRPAGGCTATPFAEVAGQSAMFENTGVGCAAEVVRCIACERAIPKRAVIRRAARVP